MALQQIEINENFFRSHITFTSVSEIAAISKPLANIGLTYFTFDRHYRDNSRICLTNSGGWIEHYWRSELYKAAVFEKDPMNFFNGYVFWDWLNREPIYSAAAEHDIDHGITITETNEQYSDFFHFGASRRSRLSHGDIMPVMGQLHHFIAHFKQKMHKLIIKAAAEKKAFPVYGEERRLIKPSDLNAQISQGNLGDFLKSTEVTKLYLGEKFNDAYLTRKEIDVLNSLINIGKIKTAADSIGLSRKTFDYHIKNVKRKLLCNSVPQLCYKVGVISERNIYPFKIY